MVSPHVHVHMHVHNHTYAFQRVAFQRLAYTQSHIYTPLRRLGRIDLYDIPTSTPTHPPIYYLHGLDEVPELVRERLRELSPILVQRGAERLLICCVLFCVLW